jgi:rubrerythrin
MTGNSTRGLQELTPVAELYLSTAATYNNPPEEARPIAVKSTNAVHAEPYTGPKAPGGLVDTACSSYPEPNLFRGLDMSLGIVATCSSCGSIFSTTLDLTSPRRAPLCCPYCGEEAEYYELVEFQEDRYYEDHYSPKPDPDDDY